MYYKLFQLFTLEHPDKSSVIGVCKLSVTNRPIQTEENQLAIPLSVTQNPSVQWDNRFHACHIQFNYELFEGELGTTNVLNFATRYKLKLG